MAASHRRSEMLWALVFAASAACVMALPAHIDDMVHPDGWKYGVRIRAVRKSEGATRSRPSVMQTHHKYYAVLAPGRDNSGAESVLHSEGELSGRYQVSEKARAAPAMRGGGRYTRPDTHGPGTDDEDASQSSGDDSVKTGEEKLEGEHAVSEKTRVTPEKRPGAWKPHPDIDAVLPVVNEDAFRVSEDDGKVEEDLGVEHGVSDKTRDTPEKLGAWQTHPDIEVVLPVVDDDAFRVVEDDVRAEEEKKPNVPAESAPAEENKPMEEPVTLSEKEDESRNKLPDTEVVLPVVSDSAFGPEDSEIGRDEVRDDGKESLKDPVVPEKEDKKTAEETDKPSESALPVASDATPQKDEKVAVLDDKRKEDSADATTQNVKVPDTPSVTLEQYDSKTKTPHPGPTEDAVEDVGKSEAIVTNEKDSAPTNDANSSVTRATVTLSNLASSTKPARGAPPEFRKNHAARPQVRPSPPRDFIADNPLYEWTFPCSDKEKSCLDEDRVLYEGDRQCYQLWRTGPCRRSEWLVIDKTEAVNGSGHFRAVCVEMSRCPSREVYMASDRLCHPLSQIIREVCPKHEGLQLSYNVFGEGECKCDNCPAPQLPTNTFNEGRCAFPPSFYDAGLHAGLQEAFRVALAEARKEVEGKDVEGKEEEEKAAIPAP